MKKRFEFSVIIPVYDCFDKLKRCLHSIPEKENLEIIVVDDKSEDKIRFSKIIKDFSNRENVKFLENTTNFKGAGICRNIGLENASGKWILFADADDFFTQYAFDVIDRYVDSSADIVYFSPTSINEADKKISDRHIDFCNLIRNVCEMPSVLSEDMLRFFWSSPWSKLIRRSLIEDNNIKFDDVIVANDVMFSMKTAALANSIEVCRDEIYIITKSEGTLTTSKNKTNLLRRVDVNIERYLFLKKILNKQRFQNMGICGLNWIFVAISNGYGIKITLTVIKKYITNHIPLFSIYLFRNYYLLYFRKNGM